MAKNTHELYRGPAIIMGVAFEGVEDWKDWERAKLSEADKLNAFKIVYDVAEGDANGARHEVKVEISHRELSGSMLDFYRREDNKTPTQMDVALRSLIGQGLLPKGANESALAAAVDDALCGREVTIRVTEDPKDDGGYWPAKAFFASKFQRLVGQAKSDRLAAFLSGKPAPKVAAVSAPSAAAMPVAPADDGDLPF